MLEVIILNHKALRIPARFNLYNNNIYNTMKINVINGKGWIDGRLLLQHVRTVDWIWIKAGTDRL